MYFLFRGDAAISGGPHFGGRERLTPQGGVTGEWKHNLRRISFGEF